MKANAVVFTEPNKVEFKEVSCPDPGPSDAVIRITHSWISNGTEGSYLRGERIQGDTAYRPGDVWPFPLVAGYQRIGVVERVGDQIDDLAVGETVFSVSGAVEGMYHGGGGQISPSVTSRGGIWKLPGAPEPLAFAGLVLTQVGYNCGVRAPIEPGEHAVVFGDGMVGHWAAQTLAWRGGNVLMVGRHDDRLARLEGTRNCRAINEKQTDWVEQVRTAAPNGLAVAVDTVGSARSTATVMGLMRRIGHIVSAGFCGTDDQVSLQDLRNGELSLDSVSGYTRERMDETLKLVADGSLQTLGLITHHFPAANAADAWDLIETKREPVLGVILDW